MKTRIVVNFPDGEMLSSSDGAVKKLCRKMNYKYTFLTELMGETDLEVCSRTPVAKKIAIYLRLVRQDSYEDGVIWALENIAHEFGTDVGTLALLLKKRSRDTDLDGHPNSRRPHYTLTTNGFWDNSDSKKQPEKQIRDPREIQSDGVHNA